MIRIKAKKLLYMVGFFKGVSGISTEPKAMKRLLRCLKNRDVRRVPVASLVVD
jgi:hypothetical protein